MIKYVAAMSFALALLPAPAKAACNYDSKDAAHNCQDAVRDYGRKTWDAQSPSYRDVEKRVNTLRDILNECKDCTMDRLNQKVDDLFD